MNAAADRRAVLDAIIAAVEEEVGRRERRHALALGPDLQSFTLEIAAGARLLARLRQGAALRREKADPLVDLPGPLLLN